MTVYAITDTKKGEQGLRLLIFKLPDVGLLRKVYKWYYKYYYYAPARRVGGIERCFCPSVCPSVAYIVNNWRTKSAWKTKIGWKVPHDKRNIAHQFQGQKVKGRGHRSTYSHTQNTSYLPNGKAYEVQTWHTGRRRRPASRTGAVSSKVKPQGHKVT